MQVIQKWLKLENNRENCIHSLIQQIFINHYVPDLCLDKIFVFMDPPLWPIILVIPQKTGIHYGYFHWDILFIFAGCKVNALWILVGSSQLSNIQVPGSIPRRYYQWRWLKCWGPKKMGRWTLHHKEKDQSLNISFTPTTTLFQNTSTKL
jgi:hypothetical protein